MKELLTIIQEWAKGFDSDFEALKTAIEKALLKIEASLFRRIMADILPALGVEDGFLKSRITDMAKVNMIERVFDELGRDEVANVLSMFSDALLEISGKNAEYYYKMGFDRAKVTAIKNDLSLVRGIIGINENGALIETGYLYRLGKSEIVREKLKQYVLTSIATRQSVRDFEGGLKNLVIGSKDVNGAISGYWQQYAYDTFNRVREVSNLHYADELNLNHFVYQGGIILTSRDFCIKKNGRVFSRADAEKWRNDPDLIDQNHKASYKPLIDRGRNNCRHFLMWISDEQAKIMQNEQ